VRLYHSTWFEAARAILAEGFRDATGYYFFADRPRSGVWFSVAPFDENEGAKSSEVTLAVDFALDESELAFYGLSEEGRPPYEWLIPADIVNAHATISVHLIDGFAADEFDEFDRACFAWVTSADAYGPAPRRTPEWTRRVRTAQQSTDFTPPTS
jgi:hypothetical protein